MLLPLVLGADKTTVSVGTGNQEFHPVYASLGPIQNDMRRAHRESVIPIAFLAIPKCRRLLLALRLGFAVAYERFAANLVDNNDPNFRLFKKQLYHQSLARILEPLHAGMTTPHVLRCPDGHYRRAIFELGPFIADYPEQVYLSGIVQGWCPK